MTDQDDPGHNDLIVVNDHGIYCPAGDFHVDPWRGVEKAIITHAHGDHARWGTTHYLATEQAQHLMYARLGPQISLQTLAYGERLKIKNAIVSLHPAGHVLGSAQVRIEVGGRVCVITGDYKRGFDKTCTPYEPVECDVFVTESTFGLPIYRWQPQEVIFSQINDWWAENAEAGRVCLLFAYSLGKAQRLLAGLNPAIGPIFCHGAVQKINQAYRDSGIELPPTEYAGHPGAKSKWARGLVVAPPSAHGSVWMRKFGEVSTAFASGWMSVRGNRRRRGVDRGFVMSDHIDWPDLIRSIEDSKAQRILVTHGATATVVRWLREQGYDADELSTKYEGELDDSSSKAEDEQAEEEQSAALQAQEAST